MPQVRQDPARAGWLPGARAFNPLGGAEDRRSHPTESLLAFCQLMEPWFRAPPHVRLMIAHCEALERGDINRLMILLPPRQGKTSITSRLFPAWCLGRNPTWQIILTSYGAELAEENSAVARNYLLDAAWPFREVHLARDTRGVARWKTTRDGICVAVGMGGSVTGRGAHSIFLDDVVKGPEDVESAAQREKDWAWYQMVARPRLMPGGRMLFTETHWHDDDVAGRILASKDAANWTLLRIPAYADSEDDPLGRELGAYLPEALIPEGEVPRVERDEISRMAFAALYQQRPSAEGGNYFSEEAWHPPLAAEHPNPPTPSPPSLRPFPVDLSARREDGVSPRERLRVYQFWDVAFSEASTADWTVAVTVGVMPDTLDLFVLDVLRKHLSPYTMAQEMAELERRWRPLAIGIEQNTFRQKVVDDLVRSLRQKSMARVVPIAVDRDKESRAALPRERAEAGKLYVDTGARWYPVFRDELLGFPRAKFDDQVDALSGACELIRTLHAPAEARRTTYRYTSYQLQKAARARMAGGRRSSSSTALWRELGSGKGR
jgi:predicted phage terminase large subunit-like protein